MKKSELYQLAMKAVLRTDYREDLKIEILGLLMAEKNVAEWGEEVKTAAENEEA